MLNVDPLVPLQHPPPILSTHGCSPNAFATHHCYRIRAGQRALGTELFWGLGPSTRGAFPQPHLTPRTDRGGSPRRDGAGPGCLPAPARRPRGSCSGGRRAGTGSGSHSGGTAAPRPSRRRCSSGQPPRNAPGGAGGAPSAALRAGGSPRGRQGTRHAQPGPHPNPCPSWVPTSIQSGAACLGSPSIAAPLGRGAVAPSWPALIYF